MAWSRRRFLALVPATTAAVAGCGGSGLSGPSTPPPSTFEVSAEGDQAIVLRYTGIGAQETARFRVVLAGAGDADGTYNLAEVTGDSRWTDEDEYRLDRESLGLDAPLSVEDLTVRLQYQDDGRWVTLLEVEPAV